MSNNCSWIACRLSDSLKRHATYRVIANTSTRASAMLSRVRQCTVVLLYTRWPSARRIIHSVFSLIASWRNFLNFVIHHIACWVKGSIGSQNANFWGLDRHAPGCRSLIVARMTLNPLDPRHNYQWTLHARSSWGGITPWWCRLKAS